MFAGTNSQSHLHARYVNGKAFPKNSVKAQNCGSPANRLSLQALHERPSLPRRRRQPCLNTITQKLPLLLVSPKTPFPLHHAHNFF